HGVAGGHGQDLAGKLAPVGQHVAAQNRHLHALKALLRALRAQGGGGRWRGNVFTQHGQPVPGTGGFPPQVSRSWLTVDEKAAVKIRQRPYIGPALYRSGPKAPNRAQSRPPSMTARWA